MRRLLVGTLIAASCGVEDAADPEALDAQDGDVLEMASPQLWWTCGDPVCSGWTAKGLKSCRGHVAGDACPANKVGSECDPGDACNATLVCDVTDPIGPGGCPISLRSAKEDISYVDAERLKALHDELLAMRLATWRYKADSGNATHLGFVIDDAPLSPAVAPNGQQVDLYAYTSMAVAALQVQQKEIEALTLEVEALRAALLARERTSTARANPSARDGLPTGEAPF